MSALAVTARGNGVRFAVHVQPRASRTDVVGTHGDALRLRVQAPPVDDAANEAVIALLAASLSVRAEQVRVVAGGRGRRKLVEVDGVSPDEVLLLAKSRPRVD